MRTFVIEEPGKTKIGSMEEPSLSSDEVLLRVRTVGFCGTDLATFRGKNPLVSYPRIPGHEIGATIEAVGEEVLEHLQEGLAVTVLPYTNCGECSACRQGRFNCCQENATLGVQRDGAFTEYISVPWRKVFPARRLSFRELALVEPLTIGFHAVERGDVEASDTVVVLGCGTIGLGVATGAVQREARVIGVDIDDWKLELAQEIGAEHVVNSATEALGERLRALTNEGPDVIVEAVGFPDTFRTAVEEVAFAGRVVYVGYPGEPVTYDPTPFVKKELDIRGSRNASGEDFKEVTGFLDAETFPVDRMVTRSVGMEEAGSALREWNDRPQKFTKIQVNVS